MDPTPDSDRERSIISIIAEALDLLRSSTERLNARLELAEAEARRRKERARPQAPDVVELGVTREQALAWVEHHFDRDDDGDWCTRGEPDEFAFADPLDDNAGAVDIAEVAVEAALALGRSWWTILDEMAAVGTDEEPAS